MTKRLLSEVGELSRDELVELGRLVSHKYSEIASETTQYFLEFGSDVLDKIFSLLSREIDVGELLKLRGVCQRFSSCVSNLRHIEFYGTRKKRCTFNTGYIINLLPNVVSIKSYDTTVIDTKWVSCKHIKELEISLFPHEDFSSHTAHFHRWVSLEKLTLDGRIGRISNLGVLASLTNLKCDASIIVNQEDIEYLTQLTSLSISGRFLPDTSLIDKLPKLIHLESQYPRHFERFTGTGRLYTHDKYSSPVPDLYFDECLFPPGIESIETYSDGGEWKDGLFTGKCQMKFLKNYKEEEEEGFYGGVKIISGPMVDYKFHGTNVKESNLRDMLVFEGEYKSGVKDGFVKHFSWDGSYEIELWSNGQKVYATTRATTTEK